MNVKLKAAASIASRVLNGLQSVRVVNVGDYTFKRSVTGGTRRRRVLAMTNVNPSRPPQPGHTAIVATQ